MVTCPTTTASLAKGKGMHAAGIFSDLHFFLPPVHWHWAFYVFVIYLLVCVCLILVCVTSKGRGWKAPHGRTSHALGKGDRPSVTASFSLKCGWVTISHHYCRIKLKHTAWGKEGTQWKKEEYEIKNTLFDLMGFPGGLGVKNLPANVGDAGLISGSGRSSGGGNSYRLQCSCQENPTDRGVHRTVKELNVTK